MSDINTQALFFGCELSIPTQHVQVSLHESTIDSALKRCEKHEHEQFSIFLIPLALRPHAFMKWVTKWTQLGSVLFMHDHATIDVSHCHSPVYVELAQATLESAESILRNNRFSRFRLSTCLV